MPKPFGKATAAAAEPGAEAPGGADALPLRPAAAEVPGTQAAAVDGTVPMGRARAGSGAVMGSCAVMGRGRMGRRGMPRRLGTRGGAQTVGRAGSVRGTGRAGGAKGAVPGGGQLGGLGPRMGRVGGPAPCSWAAAAECGTCPVASPRATAAAWLGGACTADFADGGPVATPSPDSTAAQPPFTVAHFFTCAPSTMPGPGWAAGPAGGDANGGGVSDGSPAAWLLAISGVAGAGQPASGVAGAAGPESSRNGQVHCWKIVWSGPFW